MNSQFKELADAIRAGCKCTTPGKGEFFRYGAACALGAAAIGVGIEPKWTTIKERFPVLLSWLGEYELTVAIIDRNDDQDWSRERIADWVEHEAAKEFTRGQV